MNKSEIKIRKARLSEVNDIHKILLDAFEPYKKDYTKPAFEITVMSPQEIGKRMREKNTEVWVALHENKTIGTVAVTWGASDKLYVKSMAVHRNFQSKGVGWTILEKIDHFAKDKSCTTIALESFEPLNHAIRLYKKFGFSRTGREREYFGIKIFEMIKKFKTL